MLSERTEILKSFDGTDILFRVFTPKKRDRRSRLDGLILAVHDFGDHSGSYAELAEDLCANNFALASFDLRGHGKSGPRRGDAENFQAMVADIIFMMNHSRQFLGISSSNENFFGVLGIGFGGLLATYASSILGTSCPPLMLLAPLLSTKSHIPTWKKLIATSLPRIAPIAQLPRKFLADPFMRSPSSQQNSDPLNLPSVTSRMEEILLNALSDNRVRNALSLLECPTTIVCGSADEVIDTERIHALMPSIRSKKSEIISIIDGGHNLLEIGSETREKVIEAITRWIKSNGELA